MKALGRLAIQHPVSFGLLISLMVLISYVTTAILAGAVADDRVEYELTEAIGRAAASLFFVYIAWRLDWLESSGVTKRGAPYAWVIMFVVLIYDLATTTYALFGNVAVAGISDPMLSASVATNALTTGLIEEIPFRGIILLGRPVPQAILVAVGASLSGLLYAAFLLRWKTIWTVVVLHGVSNAIVAMRVLEIPGFAETVPALVLMIVLQLPLVVYSAYLIYRLPSQQKPA
jgi:hypothetical protein